MRPLRRFTGLAVPLDQPSVDTDQIIPKQFLSRLERSGFGEGLFYDWRRREDGSPNPDFVLNRQRYYGGEILLARENFGCGSSREHAVWALQDYGFQVIIAPSFADIFKTNALKNGVLPIELDADLVNQWFRRVKANEGYRITVDLNSQTLDGSDGFHCTFEIDLHQKRCLLEGLDDIALTLEHQAAIAAYEAAHRKPWQAAVVEPHFDE